MNCIIIDPDKKQRDALLEMINGREQYEVLKSCSSLAETQKSILRNEADVIFIDAGCLGNADDFLKAFGDFKPHLVLMSATKNAAVLAFDMAASDFLLKPFSKMRLGKTLLKIQNLEKKKKQPIRGNCIFIRNGNTLEKVLLKDISFIESAKESSVIIHLSQETRFIKNPLKHFEMHVPEKDFMRVHKSFLVRLDKIDSIENEYVLMGKRKIPIGEKHRKTLMEKLHLI